MLRKPWRWWLAALGLSSASLMLAFAAGTSALGQILRFNNPMLAHRYAAQDGIASAIYADQIIARQGPASDMAIVERLARQSLRKEPINPAALRLLGLSAATKNDIQEARAWFLLSSRVSRRDFGTQLWIIENAAQSGDLRSTLLHYDIALRTSPQSNAVLFPILAAGIADPEIRSGLIPVIRSEPNWLFEFLNYAIQNPVVQPSLASLIADAGKLPDKAHFNDFGRRLLSALAVSDDPKAAKRLFLALRGASPANLATSGFNSATTDVRFNPLTWEAISTAGRGAAFGDKTSVVRILVGSGERGVVLRRSLFLVPGRYRFMVRQSPIAATQGAERDWRMTCVPARNTAQGDMIADNSTRSKSLLSTIVVIPQGCDSQIVELAVAGGTGQTDTEFDIKAVGIDRVAVEPISNKS